MTVPPSGSSQAGPLPGADPQRTSGPGAAPGSVPPVPPPAGPWPSSVPSAAEPSAPTYLASATEPQPPVSQPSAVDAWRRASAAPSATPYGAPTSLASANPRPHPLPVGGPAGATPVFAPPPPARPVKRGPHWAAVAIPAALVAALAGLGLGWAIHPDAVAPRSSVATVTTTVTASPTPEPSTTVPPPPTRGSSKPVGTINLPDSVNDYAKTKGGNTTGQLAQSAVYMKPGDATSVRTVSVLTGVDVATLSQRGTALKDFANYRCWKDVGLQACASDVDGGAILVTAAEGTTTQDAVQSFLALLLKTA